jgi:hypothetical protein
MVIRRTALRSTIRTPGFARQDSRHLLDSERSQTRGGCMDGCLLGSSGD